MKIFCTIDPFTPEAKTLLEEVATFTTNTSEAEILLVQLGYIIDKQRIDSAPHLKIIATATTGLDHIDTAYAKEKGVDVISLKEETAFLNSITSTAELALGLMISLARNIPSAYVSVLNGNWDREEYRGHSLAEKTLGIIGMGRLGKLMAQYGKGLGMKILFTDPHVEGSLPLDELLQQSDVVSLHVHLQNDTENMIHTDTLNLMKEGALLINTARGKIVNEDAVIIALESGHLGGYATDVLTDELHFEAGKAHARLIEYAKGHQNVIITPHIGGTTTESREATDIFIAKKLRDALSTSTTNT